ncbi:MAG: hypothetical protein ACRD9Q_02405 [Nitrososphaeraceae archaeon]
MSGSNSSDSRPTEKKTSKKKILLGIIVAVIMISLVGGVAASINVASKYEGLTETQKMAVKAMEDECEGGKSLLASLQSEEAAKYYTQRCDAAVDELINRFRSNHATALALQNHDVNACNSLKYKTDCVTSYVQQFGEVDKCNLLDDNTDCIIAYSVTFKKPDACNLLADNYDCILNYVTGFNEPNVCKLAADRARCVKDAIEKTGPSFCNLLDEGEAKSCKKYHIIKMSGGNEGGVISGDYAACMFPPPFYSTVGAAVCYLKNLNQDMLSAEELFSLKSDGVLVACKNIKVSATNEQVNDDYCLAAKAVYTKDVSLCDKVGVARDECYYTLAVYDNSFAVQTCDSIENENQLIYCYKLVAARTQDPSICEAKFPLVDENGRNYPRENCDAIINGYKIWLESWDKCNLLDDKTDCVIDGRIVWRESQAKQ